MSAKLTWPKWPVADENTYLRVKEVLESGRWAISGASTGAPSKEQQFATEFAKWNGSKHCITVDHGSTALVSGIEALDLGYGDEVIVPGMTWVAPVLAVLSVAGMLAGLDRFLEPHLRNVAHNGTSEAVRRTAAAKLAEMSR